MTGNSGMGLTWYRPEEGGFGKRWGEHGDSTFNPMLHNELTSSSSGQPYQFRGSLGVTSPKGAGLPQERPIQTQQTSIYGTPLYPSEETTAKNKAQAWYDSQVQNGQIKPLWATSSANATNQTVLKPENAQFNTNQANAWWAANSPAAIAPKSGSGYNSYQGLISGITPAQEDPYSNTLRDIRASYAAKGMTGSQEELNALAAAELDYTNKYKSGSGSGGTNQADTIADALNNTIKLIRERFAGLGRSGSAEEYTAIQDAAIAAAKERTSSSGVVYLNQYRNTSGGVLGVQPSYGFGPTRNPYGTFA